MAASYLLLALRANRWELVLQDLGPATAPGVQRATRWEKEAVLLFQDVSHLFAVADVDPVGAEDRDGVRDDDHRDRLVRLRVELQAADALRVLREDVDEKCPVAEQQVDLMKPPFIFEPGAEQQLLMGSRVFQGFWGKERRLLRWGHGQHGRLRPQKLVAQRRLDQRDDVQRHRLDVISRRREPVLQVAARYILGARGLHHHLDLLRLEHVAGALRVGLEGLAARRRQRRHDDLLDEGHRLGRGDDEGHVAVTLVRPMVVWHRG